MDQTVQDEERDRREPTGCAEFHALFAQLDRLEDVAPLDGGLHRLVQAMSVVRQARSDFR